MARKTKPEATDGEAQAREEMLEVTIDAAEADIAAKLEGLPEALEIYPEPEPAVVYVRVRPGYPLAHVQSAGLPWGREPVAVRADAPYLPELRRCPLLEVTE
jgi:hypothetical protein